MTQSQLDRKPTPEHPPEYEGGFLLSSVNTSILGGAPTLSRGMMVALGLSNLEACRRHRVYGCLYFCSQTQPSLRNRLVKLNFRPNNAICSRGNIFVLRAELVQAGRPVDGQVGSLTPLPPRPTCLAKCGPRCVPRGQTGWLADLPSRPPCPGQVRV